MLMLATTIYKGEAKMLTATITRDGKTYKKQIDLKDIAFWSPQSKPEQPNEVSGIVLHRYTFEPKDAKRKAQPAMVLQTSDGALWTLLLGASLTPQLASVGEGESILVRYEETVPLKGGQRFHRFSAFVESQEIEADVLT